MILLWIISLIISTVFMAFYVRKYHNSEVIIAVFVIYIALSQILASKIVTIGSWIVPAAVVIYPFIYQLTDTMNEHFGPKETKKMIVIAFVTQILMVIFISFGSYLPAFIYGTVSDEQWNTVFSQQIHIIIASWTSFLVTGILDVFVFEKVKKLTKGKYLWFRSIISDVPMLALDSLIFITLAFGILAPVPMWEIIPSLIVGQISTKWIFGVADTPFLYLDRYIVEHS